MTAWGKTWSVPAKPTARALDSQQQPRTPGPASEALLAQADSIERKLLQAAQRLQHNTGALGATGPEYNSGLQNAARTENYPCMLCGEVPELTEKWIGDDRVCHACWRKTYAPNPLWLRVLRWLAGRPARARPR